MVTGRDRDAWAGARSAGSRNRQTPDMRVVVGQLSAGMDKVANREAVARAVRLAAPHRPDLLVLPEATMHDFGPADFALAPVAEPLDGPFVTALVDAARSLGAYVIAGMFERADHDEPDHAYNTLVAVGPDGVVAASYRKLHLYDAFAYRESERLRAGNAEPPVIDVGGLAVGLMTCYDLRFPEVARSLVLDGAQALVVPAAWVRGPHKLLHWQTLLAARAIESTAYVLGAAQCGPSYTGHSAVLDPMGEVIAELDDEAGVLAADIEPDLVAATRETNPSLQNRRYDPPSLASLDLG